MIPNRQTFFGEVGFQPATKRALPEILADSIADAIASGRLAPGDRIVETVVAEQMNVSRVPLREALKVLQAQGILRGGDHKGFRVVSFEAEKIRQVLEVRIDLEVLLLRDAIAAWGADRTGFDTLGGPVEAMRRSAKLDDLPGALRADLEFHRSICEASRNEIASTLWRAIARHVLIIFSLERRDPAIIPSLVRQHEELVAFIQDGLENGVTLARLRSHLKAHILSARAC